MTDNASKTEDLWHALSDGLRAFLRSCVPSDSDADDLLQDVFVRVYENIHSLRQAGRVDSWVYQIARNAVTDFYRRRGHQPTAITPGDADNFKLYLMEQNLASTTVHKRLQFARTFFRAMVRRKLIAENPFADVKSPAGGTTDRQRFVTRDEIASILNHCPDHHWRAIVVLARYGGLRCPSEVLSLRWQDIDWDAERIVVQSPKTEHHPGKDTPHDPAVP